HTRSYGDWSSDVCSSDLGIEAGVLEEPLVLNRDDGMHKNGRYVVVLDQAAFFAVLVVETAEDLGLKRVFGSRRVVAQRDNRGDRSEERRVGKEGRVGWWA